MSNQNLFALAQNGFTGSRPDNHAVDRMIVERQRCPHCRKRLAYRGWSNADTYRAFGLCAPCGYAGEVFTESVEAAAAGTV